MTQDDRRTSIARVQRELTTVARRGTARIRRENQTLSEVDRSLLAHIQAEPGCRAVEIAAHFQLNRSTVSRQLATLQEHGLIAPRPAEVGRGVALELTAEGERVLAGVAATIQDALVRRFAGWSEQEIDEFARLLERFNAADERQGRG
ncbi:MarR family transcriptional regulator [Leifsonia sp. ku-ls]|nr:MarR family transcriptional regulator [Leifsonia sp. ku-ls]